MSKYEFYRLSSWLKYTIVLLFSLFFGFPLVWMVLSSLKTSQELVSNMWSLPVNPNLDAYRSVLAMPEFRTYYLNSLIVTVASVTILTIVAVMAAYVFARIPFPGRHALLLVFLAGMMIPMHVTLIPLYTMLREIGLLNKLVSLLFPYVAFGLPMSVYILWAFFKQIPVELEEAARLDGASTARLFWSIVLPLSRPAIGTVVILNVIGAWNEYLFALTFVSGNNRAYTLPLGIYSIVTSVATFRYDIALSALTLAALPILAFFFGLHRHIVRGLVARVLG